MFVSATQLQLKSCLSVYSASQFSSRPASQFCYTDYFGSLQKSNCKKKRHRSFTNHWKHNDENSERLQLSLKGETQHFILCTSSCAPDTSQKVFALRHSLLVGTKITQNAHDAHSHEQWTSTMNNKQWTVSKYYPAQTHLPFVIVSEKAKKIILPPCSIGTVCHALLLSLCTRCTICQHEVCTASIFECFFRPLEKHFWQFAPHVTKCPTPLHLRGSHSSF